MNYGKAIRDLRTDKRISGVALARAIDTTPGHLSSIEVGRATPSLAFLEKVAAYFQVPMPLMYQLAMTETDVRKSNVEKFKLMNDAVCGLMKEMYL